MLGVTLARPVTLATLPLLLTGSINQSNIRLLTRRVTRLTQTQAGFTEELGVDVEIILSRP